MYFSQLYSKHVEKNDDDLYGTRLIKIPAPRFYVLYNGLENIPDRVTLHLSDAFETPSEGFEWTATGLNKIDINYRKLFVRVCEANSVSMNAA